jgi:hypothetical protein
MVVINRRTYMMVTPARGVADDQGRKAHARGMRLAALSIHSNVWMRLAVSWWLDFAVWAEQA